MDIVLGRKIERTIQEVETMGTLLLQLSEDLRKLQERIEKLEAQDGNRQRRTASRN